MQRGHNELFRGLCERRGGDRGVRLGHHCGGGRDKWRRRGAANDDGGEVIACGSKKRGDGGDEGFIEGGAGVGEEGCEEGVERGADGRGGGGEVGDGFKDGGDEAEEAGGEALVDCGEEVNRFNVQRGETEEQEGAGVRFNGGVGRGGGGGGEDTRGEHVRGGERDERLRGRRRRDVGCQETKKDLRFETEILRLTVLAESELHLLSDRLQQLIQRMLRLCHYTGEASGPLRRHSRGLIRALCRRSAFA